MLSFLLPFLTNNNKKHISKIQYSCRLKDMKKIDENAATDAAASEM